MMNKYTIEMECTYTYTKALRIMFALTPKIYFMKMDTIAED